MNFAFRFMENQCAVKETGMEIALIAGTAMNVLGTIQQNKAAQESANAQAQAAEYNKQLAEMEAAAEENRRRRESDRELGAIRAGIAKSGVTSEGTPLMVLAQSAEEAELDALNARWEGQVSSDIYGMEKSASLSRAKSVRKGLPYAVGSSLLSGYTTYKSWQRT